MPVTLRDIAERTGVSPSVVSTVLSGRENGTFVSEQTRQRVLEVARQLNYVPVRTGRPRGSRRLRRQHAEQFIGVWSPMSDHSSLDIISELHTAMTEFAASEAAIDELGGLGLRLVSDTELPKLDTLGLMGLIVVGDANLPRAAAAASIPCVHIGEPETLARGAVSIHLDNFAAGQALGQYLWQLGHRSLAFVAPTSRPKVTRHRWQGLQSVWVENGAPHNACVPAPYDNDKNASITLREQVDTAVKRLFVPSAGKPAINSTSIACFDDAVAAFVLQSLHRLRKHVPDDVSVTTFGDSPSGAEALVPPVTAFRSPLSAMAREAVRELYQRSEAIGNGLIPLADTAREVKFTGELVERESCAAPGGES